MELATGTVRRRRRVGARVTASVFAALADPTRRHIVETLSEGGAATATGLATQLEISRQAVAKHLRLLAEVGIAQPERVGREVRYSADLANLDEVKSWIDDVEAAWTTRLARLGAALEQSVDTTPKAT